MIKKSKIKVEDYHPIWSKCFEELKQVFEKHLGDLILSVEHVGSTSVEGLAAKPIIDLDLIIEDDEQILRVVIQKLKEFGYDHVGDLGIPGREAFKRNSPKIPIDGSNKYWMNHHLYVCKKDFVGLLNHLKLRDYLRENSDARIKYEELKKKLAEEYPFDIDSYIEGKTEFIVNILKTLDFGESDLMSIKKQNKTK